MEHFSVEAYTPAEIAKRVETVSISKSTNDPVKVFVLAVLAGAFIALGAAFFTIVIHDSGQMPVGLMRLIGGLVFCLGLVLVVVAGAELFTGNNLLMLAFVDKKITATQLIKNWLIVYCGNFIGAIGMALVVAFSGHWKINSGLVGVKAMTIASAKLDYSFVEAFCLGVLCNILVCLAVWLCFAGRSVVDKIAAIIFPITAFVAMGFEHSVANMYFIPAGILASFDESLMAQAANISPSFSAESLTVDAFLLNNLLPVSLGNIIGGSVLVGIVYWFVYLYRDER